jgi:hypothetical protein
VDDRDLDANAERYAREGVEKLPATKQMLPPKPLRGMFGWYFKRLYVHVRPERVYVWRDGNVGAEPELFDARMEEVRSGHVEEPAGEHAAAEGTRALWDDRIDELGRRYREAVVSLVAPDGFPFSVRVPIAADRAAGLIRLGGAPVGVPWQPGLACLTAHEHHPDFKWQRNVQVRGDLVERDGAWALVPHRVVGGLELPPGSIIQRYRGSAKKVMRFRKVAKEELRRRGR